MNKPVLIVDDKKLRSYGYPTLDFNSVPLPFRKFCAFVASLNNNGTMSIGAGTLARIRQGIGIITASHLFSKNSSGIMVCFLRENDWFAVELPISNIISRFNRQDIAIIKVEYISPWFQPVELVTSRRIIIPELWAFGCPHGILGKVWKAELLAINNNDICTRGFGAPGVSGGGLFYQFEENFYLWAVHSSMHIPSQTLVSKMIPSL